MLTIVQRYWFDSDRYVESFRIVDADHNYWRAKLYDSGLHILKTIDIPLAGNGTIQTVNVDVDGARLLDIDYRDSGGITDLILKCQKPTPTPTVTDTPTEIPSECLSLSFDPQIPATIPNDGFVTHVKINSQNPKYFKVLWLDQYRYEVFDTITLKVMPDVMYVFDVGGTKMCRIGAHPTGLDPVKQPGVIGPPPTPINRLFVPVVMSTEEQANSASVNWN